MILSDLPDVEIILAGDMNARVKDLLDFIPSYDVNAIFGDRNDYPADSFVMPRKSRDTELNRFG